ncbi:Fic family protein [Arthrobacter sp. H5]|uniref:Fic family protein n=1 Tax=Arthrobacter sp. H5 TaxID=1267973 RepID=UPI0012DDBFA4|nr:Fic family protein [Arthrobacter sp. H5]
MTENSGWGVSSSHYNTARRSDVPREQRPGPDSPQQSTDRVAAMGFTWDSSAVDWHSIQHMPIDRALARFRGQLAGHVWDAAALEGNPYTLPEVQTLLEGVTVGGHRLEDERQVLALAESTELVHNLVRNGRFSVSKETADALHAVVAPHEAIEAGHFRGEGSVRGGGTVNLGEMGSFTATSSDDGGALLRAEYRHGVEYLASSVDRPAERAVVYFCLGTRRQFYFDGNKRTSRLMMNGQLLQAGLDAISIPFNRRLEFNQHLITLYSDADATPLMQFIVGCRPRG